MKKRQQAFELWMECFQDTEEFVRFYFDRKYRDENTFIHEEAGKAVAALQMIPYPMSWAGTTIETSYISGACTLPEARNQGIMTRLLAEAFRHMYHTGVAATCLIPAEPWLFDYYRKAGYAAVFNYSEETVDISELSPNPGIKVHEASKDDRQFDRYYSYFNHKMALRPCCIQHTAEDFAAILEDLRRDGGEMWIAQSNNSTKINGLALALPDENEIQIKEILFDDPDIRETLLQKIGESGKCKTVVCRQPPLTEHAHRQGMARIINVPEMLASYARQHSRLSCLLQVEDTCLEENNGFYNLSNGNSTHTKHMQATADFIMDIPTLTESLFGQNPGTVFPAFHPYMSLMLD